MRDLLAMCWNGYIPACRRLATGEFTMSEPKQVIVVRKDLNMSPGKLAAQVAHASLSAVLSSGAGIKHPESKTLILEMNDPLKEWLLGSHTKVVVAVNSEEELLEVYNNAQNAGVRRSIIKDEGRTELQGQNYTTVAIGPASAEDVNAITGKLKLL